MIDIPIMIRALASHIYRGFPGAAEFDWDWEFLQALDAGDNEHDLAAVATSYHNQWWIETSDREPADDPYLCLENLEACLDHHREVTRIKEILPRTLLKTLYTWSSHTQYSSPPGKTLRCEKCGLYRGVSLAVLTRWQDMRHLVNALEVTTEGRRDTVKRQASGVFQILDAVTVQEL